jgi:hypothetical protein
VPSYDEIINYDVWQEFLLEKYNVWVVEIWRPVELSVGLNENRQPAVFIHFCGPSRLDRYQQ